MSSSHSGKPQVPATATEFLTRFFVEDLPFTPTARQIDVFLSDLGLVSPYLMAGSLKEVRAGIVGSILVYRPNDWRPLIFQIYNRKVAEYAQLYPILHTFETVFRSTVAVTLEDHYRHSRWWRGIYQQLRNGRPGQVDSTDWRGANIKRRGTSHRTNYPRHRRGPVSAQRRRGSKQRISVRRMLRHGTHSTIDRGALAGISPSLRPS